MIAPAAPYTQSQKMSDTTTRTGLTANRLARSVPSVALDPDHVRVAVTVYQRALAWFRRRSPHTPIAVVYIPAAATTYRHADATGGLAGHLLPQRTASAWHQRQAIPGHRDLGTKPGDMPGDPRRHACGSAQASSTRDRPSEGQALPKPSMARATGITSTRRATGFSASSWPIGSTIMPPTFATMSRSHNDLTRTAVIHAVSRASI